MRQTITILVALLMTLGSHAQNIEFTFANPEITFDGGTFYEVDVMIAAVEGQTDFKLGKGQVYINYDTDIFGTFINGSSGIEVSYPVVDGYILGQELFAGFPYYSTSGTGISDNSDSRFSFAYQQAVSSGSIASNNVIAGPTRLFHIKMTVTGSLPSMSFTPIVFEDDETQVANCRDQFETACGPGSGGAADCAGFPGVVFNNALFDSTSAEVLSVSNPELVRLNIYPNPAKEMLNISGLDEKAEITVIDLAGRIVLEMKDFKGSELDISQLEMATYLMEIKTENQVYKTRFIKN